MNCNYQLRERFLSFFDIRSFTDRSLGNKCLSNRKKSIGSRIKFPCDFCDLIVALFAQKPNHGFHNFEVIWMSVLPGVRILTSERTKCQGTKQLGIVAPKFTEFRTFTPSSKIPASFSGSFLTQPEKITLFPELLHSNETTAFFIILITIQN